MKIQNAAINKQIDVFYHVNLCVKWNLLPPVVFVRIFLVLYVDVLKRIPPLVPFPPETPMLHSNSFDTL